MALTNPSASPPAWINPVLLNNWANVGGTLASCQYRKFDNIVEIKGIVQPLTGTTPASGSILMNLPSGYRPLQTRYFGQWANSSGAYVMGLFRIGNNGDCSLFFTATSITSFATQLLFVAEQ